MSLFRVPPIRWDRASVRVRSQSCLGHVRRRDSSRTVFTVCVTSSRTRTFSWQAAPKRASAAGLLSAQQACSICYSQRAWPASRLARGNRRHRARPAARAHYLALRAGTIISDRFPTLLVPPQGHGSPEPLIRADCARAQWGAVTSSLLPMPHNSDHRAPALNIPEYTAAFHHVKSWVRRNTDAHRRPNKIGIFWAYDVGGVRPPTLSTSDDAVIAASMQHFAENARLLALINFAQGRCRGLDAGRHVRSTTFAPGEAIAPRCLRPTAIGTMEDRT